MYKKAFRAAFMKKTFFFFYTFLNSVIKKSPILLNLKKVKLSTGSVHERSQKESFSSKVDVMYEETSIFAVSSNLNTRLACLYIKS